MPSILKIIFINTQMNKYPYILCLANSTNVRYLLQDKGPVFLLKSLTFFFFFFTLSITLCYHLVHYNELSDAWKLCPQFTASQPQIHGLLPICENRSGPQGYSFFYQVEDKGSSVSGGHWTRLAGGRDSGFLVPCALRQGLCISRA